MQPRKITLYLKTTDLSQMTSFLAMYDHLSIVKTSDFFIFLEADPFAEIDWLLLREMAMQEIYQDFVAFLEPHFFISDHRKLLPLLTRFSPGVYTIETLIPELIVLGEKEWKMMLRNLYFSRFSQETLDTVKGFILRDLNASKAAKELYMHRNTLNYRIDHFCRLTEINVRSFQGAHAFYLLMNG